MAIKTEFVVYFNISYVKMALPVKKALFDDLKNFIVPMVPVSPDLSVVEGKSKFFSKLPKSPPTTRCHN